MAELYPQKNNRTVDALTVGCPTSYNSLWMLKISKFFYFDVVKVEKTNNNERSPVECSVSWFVMLHSECNLILTESYNEYSLCTTQLNGVKAVGTNSSHLNNTTNVDFLSLHFRWKHN